MGLKKPQTCPFLYVSELCNSFNVDKEFSVQRGGQVSHPPYKI